MSWSTGLALWLLGSGVVLWIVGEVLARFAKPDELDDTDHVAERKRKIARRAKQQSREYAP